MARRTKPKAAQDKKTATRSNPVRNYPSSEVQRRPRWHMMAVCLFLVASIWAVFGQTLHFGFVSYDDNFYIYANPAVNHGLNWHWIVWIFSHTTAGTWFPLSDISHQLDWQIYGNNAGGHHLTNVLLHAVTVILLFLAISKLTGTFWRAAFVAAVFAIHPLRVESVAWVTERKDVLSGVFFTLTLWAWAGHVEKRRLRASSLNDGNRNVRLWTSQYILALFFFALGLLSKSMLVTLPFVLLLLDYWPLKRFPPWRNLVLEKIPFFLLSASFCVVTVMTQIGAVSEAGKHTLAWRAGNALLAYADYLWHMVYPASLMVGYPPSETNPSPWSASIAALILIGLTAVVIAGRKKHPYLIIGWFWYLGMLLPVIDIVQSTSSAHADRYTYLPQIGLYILVAWGAVELCNRWRYRRTVLGCMAGIVLIVLLVTAHIQTGYWKDSVTLWTHTLACGPDNSMAQSQLGIALNDEGMTTEAIPHYELALRLDPDNTDAHNNLGNVLAGQGQLADAIQQYEQTLTRKPDNVEAHINLGNVLAMQGKPDEAVPHFERALQLRPDDPECLNNLGVVLASQGKMDKAMSCLQQALALATAQGDVAYAQAVQTRINYYQSASVQHQSP